MVVVILIVGKIGWEIVILIRNRRKMATIYQRRDRNRIGIPKIIKKEQKQEEIELYEDMTANKKISLPTIKE